MLNHNNINGIINNNRNQNSHKSNKKKEIINKTNDK